MQSILKAAYEEVNDMKEGIHPKYYQTTIKCACGNVISTGSTRENITVEICSKCHPFYTGKQKLVDTSGRVDKFNKKYGWHLEQISTVMFSRVEPEKHHR